MSSIREQVTDIIDTPFTYSPLPPEPNTTRMIRLLPNRDKSAQIQCELFNYTLSQSGNEKHFYEALSYVWGSPVRSHSIMLNGCRLLITESLHTALLHLRGRQLERILWVDAISIKQDDDNDNEKSEHIPLMRKIYAQARGVVVWLGEAQEYGDKALDIIGNLGRKQVSMPIKERDREICDKLLQRDWFRRIWVLQEVGVAQHISIVCGSVQINGHIFCEGLDSLESSPALMATISPVSFLIKEAPFRSYDNHHSTATLSIGELVSMYRNHNATIQHDKIYALLGLSADRDSTALVPNYKLAWHEVFERLTLHVFPKCSVETWYGSELAIVRCKGWVLGYIHSISNSLKGSQQTFNVHFNHNCQKLGYHDKWKTEWSLQASGELIQDGDIVCLLEGHSEPSILRLCVDYYAVVTPVVKPNKQVQNNEDNVVVGESHSPQGLCDLLLVWKVPLSEDRADLQSLSRLIEIAPNHNEEHYEVEQRLNHITSVMVDAAMQVPELGLSGKGALHNVLSKGGINLGFEYLLWMERKFFTNHRAAIEQALWQQDGLLYAWEKVLAVAIKDSGSCGYIVSSILIQRQGKALTVSEEVVKAAAANEGDYGFVIMQQLFERYGHSLPVSEEVVKAAAANDGRYGPAILQRLFEYYGHRLPVSEEVVKAAAANEGDYGFLIMQQLFEYYGDSLPVSEEVVKVAAANEGPPIMQQLFERYGDSLPVSEEVVKAAAANDGRYGPAIMQQLFEYYGHSLPVSEEVVKAAATNKGDHGFVIMQQLLKQYGNKLTLSEAVVKAAAANNGRHGFAIMQQLFECYGNRLPVSEEVVKAAAANEGDYGFVIMQQLFERYGDSLPVSEEVVKAAAANEGDHGFVIMQQLLKQYGNKLTLSEAVVKAAAANNGRHGFAIMQQLFKYYGDNLPVSEEMVKTAAAT